MWLPPLLSVLLLGPMSTLCFSFAPPSLPHFNGSTSRSSGLSGSPNWYSSLPLLLTTTAPPNASQVNDNDWLDAPEAEVHSPSPVFSSERSPPSPPREQSHDELCVHDSSSNTLTGHLSSGRNGQNDIRVASNCRSAVKKLDALKFYESSRLRMAQASAPSGSTYSGRNNFTNNFISPHTANVKTSPNGQITVLNGKSVTPILYADERPHLLPQYERWMAPTTAKSYLVTAKPEIANDEAEKKDDDEDEDGAEEGAEDEGGDNEEGNEPAKTEKADNSETDSQVKLEPSSTPNSSPTSTSTPTTSTTTVTATSSESPILPSTSTTRTLPKNRFLTRRPDYFGKSKFGDKLTTDNPEKGSQSGPNLPSNHGQANWSPSLTTRKPVSHLYATSTTTTSPPPGRSYLVPSSTTSSVPNKMNSQIEALRARYKQANSAGKGNGKATETPSTTAMPKVKVEYTTTTTTTTESVLKFAQNPLQENKDSSQPQEEDNQRHPQSKNHNYLPTEQPPYGYNKASPTDTTKKQIPKPNSGRYREPVSFPPTRPFSSSTSPRPYPYPEPTYIRVEPSPSPPYPVKMSLPQNAYYTPLPNVELNRLPTPTSAYSRPESVPEYTGNHHRQPNEQYQAHPSTPKPEVFVTIENQVYVVRNQTPIVEEEIALPQAGNDYYYGPHHHQEQQLHPHNKFNGGDITHNVISYQTYEEDSKKPYKMHQHLATTGHGPPMPLKQALPTFSSQVLADILKRPSKSQEIPSNDMYFYYDNHSHQPKHNHRVPSANQVYPQSSSYSSSSSSTFDDDTLQLTPGIRQHLKSLAHFEDESSPILSHSRGPMGVPSAESMRGASPAARHQIKDITLPPSRPSMTVSFGAVSEPTLASYSRVPPSAGRGHSSSSPEQLRSSSSKLQDLYKAIDIAPNRANPIVFGDRNALKTSGSSNQVSSPGLSSSQTDSGSSAKLETIKDIYPNPSSTKDPHEQTFTLVRHYVRTYGYDDPANSRPTELQFDSKLNVDLKSLNQIGSLTSDLRKSHPSFSSSKYFGMPRQPSFASSPSNDDFPPAPPRYVTKYHPESNRHLSSPTPTHEAYVVRVNIPPTMATNTNSQRYKLHMSDVESMSRPSQLPPPPYHVFSSPSSSSKPTKASFSSYFLQNHEPSFASKANILPVETTIFESKPFHFTSSNNFNKPLLTLDSNLHNSKNSFSHVGLRPQPAHENDIMEEGISESQVRELMKPLLKDPFEDYYSDRILPLNAMLDYSNVFWNAQRQQQAELNRQPAVSPSESQQSNKWMQLPDVKPTVKSKLKDFLSMFNEVTGSSSQQNHSSALASATSVVPIFAEHPTASSRLPERLQPVFEKIQFPERPKNMPSKSLFGKPQAFGQGVNQDLDMSGSAPMATVIARPSTSLSAAPTPAEMFPWFANSLQNQQLLGEMPTTDANRSRRNQRLLKSLKSILGFVGSNPNLSLPAVDPSSAP